MVTALVATASISLSAAPALATVGAASSAQDDSLTASEIEDAVTHARTSRGSAVATAAPTTSDADAAAITHTKDGTDAVRVPTTPTEGVALSPGTTDSLKIDLPNTASASSATTLPDGAIAYPSRTGSANVVIPTPTGAQFLTVIANRDAPQRYTYPLALPDGAKITLTTNGGARVIRHDGTTLAMVAPAWARDSDGTPVPTHFETDGTSLTQVIHHSTTPNLHYPVIADPEWWQVILAGAIGAAVSGALSAVIGPGFAAMVGGCVAGSLIAMWDGRDFWGGFQSCLIGAVGGAIYSWVYRASSGIISSILSGRGIRP